LTVRSKKTLTDTRICLPDYAVNILVKYKRINGDFLMPRFNIVNMNLYLKKLFDNAGFTNDNRKVRNRRGVMNEIFRKRNNSNIVLGLGKSFANLS